MDDMHRFVMFTLAAIAGMITAIVGIPNQLGISFGTYFVGCLKLTGLAWIAGATIGIVYYMVYRATRRVKR